MSEVSATPKCPSCGFTVFTNRYPKCEKCGQALPTELVLSKSELDAVLEKERVEELAVREAKQRRQPLGHEGFVANVFPDFSAGVGVGGD